METEPFRNVLRKLKYIMLNDKKHLSRLETLLRWLIEGSVLGSFVLFHYVGSKYYGLPNPLGIYILFILGISYVRTLEYFRKKASQEKKAPR
jgi:hypothetical protein